MTSIERMFAELESQGKTIQSLCNYIGITSSVIANWKSRSEFPPAKYIVTICEFLDVSADYLLSGNNKFQNLEPNQIKLLNILGNIGDKDEQMMLIGAADSYAKTLSSYSKTECDSKQEASNKSAI